MRALSTQDLRRVIAAGRPYWDKRVRTRVDEKLGGFVVRMRYFTPDGYKSMFGLILLVFGGAAVAAFENEMPGIGLGAIATGALFWIAMEMEWSRDLLAALFGAEAQVILGPSEIALARFAGWEIYSLSLPHEFHVALHERAAGEEEYEREIRKRTQRLYRKSWQVWLLIGGERHILLASVYGSERKAQAFHARLYALGNVMRGHKG